MGTLREKRGQERRRGGMLLVARVERRMLARKLESWVQLLALAVRALRIGRKAFRRRLTSLFPCPETQLFHADAWPDGI